MVYPMFAMVLLTYGIGIYILVSRIKAVRTQKVSVKYFRVFKGDDIPEHIVAGTNHFTNLFQTPLFFYLVSLLILIFKLESTLLIAMAWAYVVLRAGHAFIHMGHNNVMHRMMVFWAGILLLLAMWFIFVIQYSNLQ